MLAAPPANSSMPPDGDAAPGEDQTNPFIQLGTGVLAGFTQLLSKVTDTSASHVSGFVFDPSVPHAALRVSKNRVPVRTPASTTLEPNLHVAVLEEIFLNANFTRPYGFSCIPVVIFAVPEV